MMPLQGPLIGPFVEGDTLALPYDNSSRHISPLQPSRSRAQQSPVRVIVEDPPPSDEEGEQCEHREDYYKYPGQRGRVTDLEVLPANVIQVEDEEQRAVSRSAVGDDKTRSEDLERCDQACYKVNRITGDVIGSVMWTNLYNAFAPSIEAASYSGCGTCWRAAR